ncbi:DUF362 domain-containing protein [Natrinema longum]|uniref:DUF362 domain-containing protein n=1 Tax=Natrinema longum TaxID=370324 RepID=A0A8A2UCU1_9EURY|nr:DUF362 domain-containing protein [Natrinema longum]MBZ6495739.1 DUF362 domain-containing protein [Natrinema longum]QSW86302.1 DUF362 domain-containing protein [Natrinema longum]
MSTARVRAAAVDAAERRGGWLPDIDRRVALFESPVRDVLEPAVDALADADRITLVPDAHYPFHPSSGMVTDPAVIGAIVARLEGRTDADIAVAGASDEHISFDRTVQYLGYESLLEGFDADAVDLADEPRTGDLSALEDAPVALSVPNRLAEGAVIVVPSLRATAAGPVAGAMRTLADLVDCDAASDRAAVAATRAVDPAVAVLDATTAYGGDPVAGDTLFAGSAPAVDAVATSLLGRSFESDGALETVRGDRGPISVEGDADFDRLRERIPDGELPPSDDMHPAVSTAYRVYAAVAGDAVPPQLEGGR